MMVMPLAKTFRRHGKLIGAIWTEGEGLCWQARATSNIAVCNDSKNPAAAQSPYRGRLQTLT
jgi:hypothetical protein